MDRAVYTVALGKARFAEMAMGLGRSLSLIGDDTPRVVLTDIDGPDWERYFDVVIRERIPKEEYLWAKLRCGDFCSAQRVLFVDADSLAFKRLDPIFKAFEGAPLGVQAQRMTEGTWHGKSIADLCGEEQIDSLPMLNAGLLYYEPGVEFEAVLAKARSYVEMCDAMGFKRFAGTGAVSIEPCLALALATTGLGRDVPETSNFSNSGVGVVGKLELDVLRNRCRYIARRYDVQFVEPTLFHAHFWSKYRIYWKQLDRLKWLERYEDSHPYGYFSPWSKLSRSVQRRILKMQGRL